jgi:hypothetical protein
MSVKVSVTTLPPHLADLHTQLERSGSPHVHSLRTELDLVNQLIEETRAANPNAAILRKLETMRQGYTTTSGETCNCCGRRF